MIAIDRMLPSQQTPPALADTGDGFELASQYASIIHYLCQFDSSIDATC